MSLREWWRKITGTNEPPPGPRETEPQGSLPDAPSPSDEGTTAAPDSRTEEIDPRTLEDEEIL